MLRLKPKTTSQFKEKRMPSKGTLSQPGLLAKIANTMNPLTNPEDRMSLFANDTIATGYNNERREVARNLTIDIKEKIDSIRADIKNILLAPIKITKAAAEIANNVTLLPPAVAYNRVKGAFISAPMLITASIGLTAIHAVSEAMDTPSRIFKWAHGKVSSVLSKIPGFRK